jgi:hypothetical protein
LGITIPAPRPRGNPQKIAKTDFHYPDNCYLVAMKRAIPALFLALILCLFLSACSNQVQKIEGTKWEVQCRWQSQGLTKIEVTFNEDGSITYTDDSSGTYQGSWTSSGNGNVAWNVDAPGRLPSYRATYDNRIIEGTATDITGDNATLTGDEL